MDAASVGTISIAGGCCEMTWGIKGVERLRCTEISGGSSGVAPGSGANATVPLMWVVVTGNTVKLSRPNRVGARDKPHGSRT